MITRIRKQIFSLRHIYNNPLDKQRAQVLLFLNIAVVVVTLISTVFLTIPSFASTGHPDITGLVSSIVVVIAAVMSYRFIQQGRLTLAIWIVLVAITLGTLSAVVFGGNDTPSITTGIIVFLPVPIVVAGVLLDRRGLVAITVLTLAAVVVSAMAESTVRTPVVIVPAEVVSSYFISIVLSILSILFVLVTFLGTLQRVANEAYEVGKQRQRSNKLGLELGTIDNEPDLLNTALREARESLGRRFVEVYLVNEDGNLVFFSPGGARRSAIRSTDPNILAEATRSRILLTTSLQDEPARHSHMAASTNYAVAVPIMVNNNLMGVLDFQDVVSIPQSELNTLQEFADQIALNLQRVRVKAELEIRVGDQEKTINRLQLQMQSFNQRQQQNISELWGGYVQGRGRQAIGYNLESGSVTPIQATDLPGGLAHTLKYGQLEVSTQGNEQVINVPIKFRDTNLGAMSFSVPADQPLNQRQIEVATTVAERLALALENTRLFEQSQSQALRERKASEVTTALIGATDVRVVLNMAAEQFKDALGAVNTRIYIQPETLMEPLAQTQEEK